MVLLEELTNGPQTAFLKLFTVKKSPALKVPKRENFDLIDSFDFFSTKPLWV